MIIDVSLKRDFNKQLEYLQKVFELEDKLKQPLVSFQTMAKIFGIDYEKELNALRTTNGF